MSDSDDDNRGDGPSILSKRPRTETESLIQQTLKEEEARKKSKKGGAPAAGAPPPGKKKDGKTLAEIEEEEGGPIKESLVGMAHVKRAANRKADGKEGDDTTIPTDVDKYEEAAQVRAHAGSSGAATVHPPCAIWATCTPRCAAPCMHRWTRRRASSSPASTSPRRGRRGERGGRASLGPLSCVRGGGPCRGRQGAAAAAAGPAQRRSTGGSHGTVGITGDELGQRA